MKAKKIPTKADANIVDWDRACLICLQNTAAVSLYSIQECDKHCPQMIIYEKIRCISPLLAKVDWKLLPQNICASCLNDLNASWRFRQHCQAAYTFYKSLRAETIQAKDETNLLDQQLIKIPAGLQIRKVSVSVEEAAVLQSEPNVEPANALTINAKELVNPLKDPTAVDSSLNEIQDELQVNKTELEEASTTVTASLSDDDIKVELIEIDEVAESWASDDAEDNIKTTDIRLMEKKEVEEEVVEEELKDPIKKVELKTLKRSTGRPCKICELCGNRFKYQHALNAHMRRHNNDKPFVCEFCHKAFVSSVEMQRHMRVHTRQKPYACHYCERCFSDYGSRIKHERTHTGEKPYKCHTCAKSFAYAHVLSVHTRTHTGEKKYQCDLCQKGFTKKKYLQAHTKQHGCTNQSIDAALEQNGYKSNFQQNLTKTEQRKNSEIADKNIYILPIEYPDQQLQHNDIICKKEEQQLEERAI